MLITVGSKRVNANKGGGGGGQGMGTQEKRGWEMHGKPEICTPLSPSPIKEFRANSFFLNLVLGRLSKERSKIAKYLQFFSAK